MPDFFTSLGFYRWLILAVFLLALVFVVFLVLRRKRPSENLAPLTDTLRRAHQNLGDRIRALFGGPSNKLDPKLFSQIEEILLEADVGVKTTHKLLERLYQEIPAETDWNRLKECLKTEILSILKSVQKDFETTEKTVSSDIPEVILVVGINGVGKTTTIGKLAKKLKIEGKKVLIACGDTFRAGAVSQLKVWAERTGAMILSQADGADPASVAYDAVKAGEARGIDKVIIDTAGRLHNKVNLMEEMKKIKRVIQKAKPDAPHEIYLVIDATTGQNALNQAKEFHEALGLTGLILTKLDGTAKGGMVIAIYDSLKIPIRYIGVGERADDLKSFDADQFVDTLLD